MAFDNSYNVDVYRQQDGSRLVVGTSGTVELIGELHVASGGTLTAAGTQASAPGQLSTTATTTANDTIVAVASTTDANVARAVKVDANFKDVVTKINTIITALEGVGIVAST